MSAWLEEQQAGFGVDIKGVLGGDLVPLVELVLADRELHDDQDHEEEPTLVALPQQAGALGDHQTTVRAQRQGGPGVAGGAGAPHR